MKIRIISKKQSDSGIVSLLIVAIMAIVLGLVAVGFSQLTNRELKQASDRELSAQAYYAAQSGLNDAMAYLENGGPALNGCSDWQTTPPGPTYFTSQLTSTARYSCVSVQTKVPNLWKRLSAGQSYTYKLDNTVVPSMTKLYFGWANQGAPHSYNGSPLGNIVGGVGQLPQESSALFSPSSLTTGLLHVSIYAVPNGTTCPNNDCSALAAASRSYFMYPNSGLGGSNPGSVGFGANQYNPLTGPSSPNGEFLPGNCKNNNTVNPVPNPQAPVMYCNTLVSGLDSGSNTYYVRITALYMGLNVSLQAESGSSAVGFNGVQGNIDVTGQGTDVLQRINTTVDLSKNYQSPDYAIQSMMAICKGFEVEVSGPNQYKTNSATNVLTNPDGACTHPGRSDGVAPGGGLSPH